jgi:peptide/nickel transport system substrate-binding protein
MTLRGTGAGTRKPGPLLACGVVVLSLVAAACSSGGSGGNGTSSPGATKVLEGGTLRIGSDSTIDSLNPFVAFNQDAYTTFEYIYPFLVQLDEKLQFTKDFATSWETSSDGLTWTFHTRPNAKWSDGQPLTAEDAAWTINTDVKYKDGAAANASGLIAHIKNAETPDPNTLVVHYESPVGNVLGQLQQLAILPMHVWKQHEGDNGKDLKSFDNGAPVVSGGPFVLQQFKKDEIALFAKNPNFYGTKPHIDGFGLKLYSNDDAMITALKSGELDAIEQVPPTSAATLKAAGVVVKQVPSVLMNDFIINSNPKKTVNRELLDPKVKEAFAHAIDREQIVQVVWLNTAKPASTIVPPSTGDWHNPNIKPETFDLDLANQMLDDAGFKKGPDGIRVANGHKMSYQVITPNDLTGVDRSFQIIQSDFTKIGVDLKQRSLDSSAAFDEICGKDCTAYDKFDLAMWDWIPLIDPDFILSVLTCAQYGGWSDTGYCNPAYDRLYAKQGATLDQEARKQIVWQMQQMVFDDRPYIILNYQDWIYAYTKKWDGFVSSPQGIFDSLSKQSLTQVHRTS